MPNKKRNKNRQGNPDHRVHHAHGIQKKHYQKGHYQHDRRTFIAPHLITDDFDEDFDKNQNSQKDQIQQQQQQQPRSSGRYRRDQKRRNAIISKFDEMVVFKDKPKKLSIGDTDTEPKKIMLPSQPHCKLAGVPDEVFNIIVKFLQDYFTCYDSNREALLGAYNPKVLFSLTVNTTPSNVHRVFNFENYIKESRNIKRVCANDEHQSERCYKQLHQGHLDAVNMHTKLPPTQHEPSSFKLDHYFFTPHMISFTVSGVFKEGKETDKVRPIRSFQRVFVCVPDANTGMSIVNEQYVIANIQLPQYKTYYKEKETNRTQQQTSSDSVQLSNENSILNECNHTQKQMIQQFSAMTNLNLRWSLDCLKQVDWNYDAAHNLFNEYKPQLPASAFLTS